MVNFIILKDTYYKQKIKKLQFINGNYMFNQLSLIELNLLQAIY